MARTYRLGLIRRLVNRIVTGRVKAGKPVGADVRLLTTTGCRTGLERTTPVTIVEVGGEPWLVAPYGAVSWVHNLRADPHAVLATADGAVEFRALPAEKTRSAEVLKHYVTEIKVVRPYFDVAWDAPVEAFEAVTTDKPVFGIEPLPPA